MVSFFNFRNLQRIMRLPYNYYKRLWEDYERFSKELDCVIPDVMPIPFFGDIEAYFSSLTRVVTVSLNPSSNEFPEDFRFDRFRGFDGNILSIESACAEYFNSGYGYSWFDSGFEPMLRGLGSSYYVKNAMRVALHTDLNSPFATDPTWSGLSNEQQLTLAHHGVENWKKLIGYLKPDIIISSVGSIHLSRLDLQYPDTYSGAKGERISVFNFPFSEEDNAMFVSIPGKRGQPLFGYSNSEKLDLGQTIAGIASGEVGQAQEELPITNSNVLTIVRTRFYVDEAIYTALKQTGLDLRIEIFNQLRSSNAHENGYYLIPNKIALDFIEEKRRSYNWKKNKNFNQGGSGPKYLRSFFTQV